jgi:hypothetical protein
MISNWPLVLIAVVLLASTEASLEIPIPGGRDRITYDSANTSKTEVEKWVRLSPNVSPFNYYMIPESLELCIDGDPIYEPCGTRNLSSPNFLFNANVNLRKIRDRISGLRPTEYPASLRTVVFYLRQQQSLHLQAEENRLNYYQSHDRKFLSAPISQIDVKTQCDRAIAEIKQASETQAYRLTSKEWSNCVNNAIQSRVGVYPSDDWKRALNQLRIEERLIEDEPE